MTKIWTKTLEVTECRHCPNIVGNCGKDFCVPLQEFCTVLPLPNCPLPDKPSYPSMTCCRTESERSVKIREFLEAGRQSVNSKKTSGSTSSLVEATMLSTQGELKQKNQIKAAQTNPNHDIVVGGSNPPFHSKTNNAKKSSEETTMKKVRTYCLVTTCALFGKECKFPGYPTITGTKMSLAEAKKYWPDVEFCSDYRTDSQILNRRSMQNLNELGGSK